MEIFCTRALSRFVASWAFLFIIFGWSAACLCADRKMEAQSEVIESALIKSKGDNGVLIDGRRYRVSESTVILNLLGKKISLCDLLVPCEAHVEFRMIDGQDPLCLQIAMTRLLEDSKDSS